MARTQSYINKLNVAVKMFQDGISCVNISKELKMDVNILRKNLKEYGYIDSNIDKDINLNSFSKIETEEQAYWLGFMYADGYISNDSNKVELCIKDFEHLIKFKNFINTRCKISEKKVKINGKIKIYYRLGFRNKQIHSDLIKCGCKPNKSLILTFPNEEILPNHLIHHFIRGYFDGDGCIHKYEYENSLTVSIVGTKNMLEHIKSIYDFPENKYIMDGKAYEYRIANKSKVYNFLEKIYNNATIYLERKYEIYNTCRFK